MRIIHLCVALLNKCLGEKYIFPKYYWQNYWGLTSNSNLQNCYSKTTDEFCKFETY